MSYTEWLRELAKLPKSAEFCLTDVSERISSGDKVVNFLITEAKGQDIDDSRRRGQTKEVCRPRIYFGIGDVDMSADDGERIEIKEPVGQLDKQCISAFSVSLHEMYILQSRLCESVLGSLTNKIGVIAERSTALLESQLGDEVIKLVTAKLEGIDVGMASLKNLLVRQITSAMPKQLVQPVHRLFLHDERKGMQLQRIEFQENDDLYWKYEAMTYPRFGLYVTWKGVTLSWTGQDASISGQEDAVCVRDTFLFVANLPSFASMITARLAKILE